MVGKMTTLSRLSDLPAEYLREIAVTSLADAEAKANGRRCWYFASASGKYHKLFVEVSYD